MTSKQINFFLLPNDYLELDNLFVKKLNTAVINTPLQSKKLIDAGTLNFREKDDLKILICLKEGLELIEAEEKKYINTSNTFFTIDIISSPVAEFNRCYFNSASKQLRRGRFYFVSKYYDTTSKKVCKSSEFLEVCNKILLELKKQLILIKDGEFKGFYMSKKVKDWIENEGGILIN